MNLRNIFAGFVGAAALNLLHEAFKRSSIDSPRVDELGKEAVQKSAHCLGKDISDDQQLYQTTLIGDLIANTGYYSMIGSSRPLLTWSKAIALGLAAGYGAVELPKPMGLNPEPVNANLQRRYLTVGLYLFGALVTATLVQAITKKHD